MKHYRILSNDSEDSIAEEIEQAINDGWEVTGPLVVSGVGDMRRFYQPIMKIKPERPNLRAV